MNRVAGAVREVRSQPDFARLLTAQFVAQFADGVAQAAFATALVLVPLAEGTPTQILAVFTLTLLPYSVIAPFTGVLVDRWARRRVLVVTNVVRGALLVTLPIWGRGLPGNTGLYAGLLLLLGLGRLFLVTKGASLPVLLREHHLLRGNAISGGGGMVAALVGGVVGVGAVAFLSARETFVVAGFIYGLSAVVSRSISQPMAHPDPPAENISRATARIARELIEGVGVIWRHERARLPLIGIFVLRVSAMFMAIAAILLIKSDFPQASDRFGRLSAGALVLGAAGLGAFVGAVTAPWAGRHFDKPRLLLGGFLVSGGAMVVAGPLLSLPALVAMTLAGGYGALLGKIAVDAQVQEELPDRYRGRAFALYDILYNLASIAAALVMVLFASTSLRVMVVAMGAVTLALGALVGVAMKGAHMFRAVPAPD